MGYPRWISMELDNGTHAVGECANGDREYVQIESCESRPEALVFIARLRTDAHTRRTLDWRARRDREARTAGKRHYPH